LLFYFNLNIQKAKADYHSFEATVSLTSFVCLHSNKRGNHKIYNSKPFIHVRKSFSHDMRFVFIWLIGSAFCREINVYGCNPLHKIYLIMKVV